MRLSIVIISWNSLPMLRRCLESLRPLLGRTDVELVWVDNGSSDGAPAFMDSAFPHARTRLLPDNRGVAYARNRGVELARGQYILFLDDDTEAPPEALDTLMAHLDTHPRTGVAACALRDKDGNLQDSFKPYPGLWQKIRNVLRSKLSRKPRAVALPQEIIHPVYVIGACQMIRRQVFDRVGLLDEAIFYGPEDADLCIRARACGWDIDYLPQVSILHHWRRITTRSLTSRSSRRHIRALLHFWRKHRRL